MTPQDVLIKRLQALDTIESDPSHALALLCEVTRMEAELRATGQRAIMPPLITPPPRCPLRRINLDAAPLRVTEDGRKKFDPQLRLF